MNSSSSSSESLLFILCGLEEGNVWSSVVAVTDSSENKIQNVNLIMHAESQNKIRNHCQNANHISLIFAYYYTYEYTTIYNFSFLVTTYLGSIFREVHPP